MLVDNYVSNRILIFNGNQEPNRSPMLIGNQGPNKSPIFRSNTPIIQQNPIIDGLSYVSDHRSGRTKYRRMPMNTMSERMIK